MVVMVIVLVFLHLTVKQVKTDEIRVKCPSVCNCPNRTVAICNNQRIDGISPDRDSFESSVEKLEFSGNKLTLLDDDTLPKWKVPNLRSLNLSGNRIVNITRYAFQGFDQLEDLDLSRNNVSSIHFESSVFLPKLAVLRLAGNRLTEIHPVTFTELFHLRHLDLSNNIISAIHTGTFFNNSDLEWLSLAKNEISEIGPHVFQNQHNLSYLDLSENLITKIEGGLFYYNRKLETLLLAGNDITEFNALAFHEESELSDLDVSRNRIGKLESLTLLSLKSLDISKNSLQSLRSRSFSNLRDLRSLSLAGNNILEINDEAFYGLEKLEHLDLSSNNITFISFSVFQNMFPSAEINGSKKIELNLSNNRIHSVNFGECHPCNTTYNISSTFFKIALLDMRQNCLTVLDDSLVNLLKTSGTLINHTGNPCPYECSLSQGTYKAIDGTSLNCVSQGDIRIKICNLSERNNCSTTKGSRSQTDGKEGDDGDRNEPKQFLPDVGNMNETNKNGPNPFLPANDGNKDETEPLVQANIFIFGIYAASVFVSIIVVLVITHVVGKPEPDEFWWEDELAKRNY